MHPGWLFVCFSLRTLKQWRRHRPGRQCCIMHEHIPGAYLDFRSTPVGPDTHLIPAGPAGSTRDRRASRRFWVHSTTSAVHPAGLLQRRPPNCVSDVTPRPAGWKCLTPTGCKVSTCRPGERLRWRNRAVCRWNRAELPRVTLNMISF